MARKSKAKGAATTIVIRREEGGGGGGHHGGAWKVAYADFVTAMMAFFLVMWLINATTEKQRRGLADYFSPIAAHTRSASGSGKPFGGLTPYESGAMVSNRGAVSVQNSTGGVPAPGSGQVAPGGPARALAQDASADSDPSAMPVQGDADREGGAGHGGGESGEDQDAAPGASHGIPVAVDPAGSTARDHVRTGDGHKQGTTAAEVVARDAAAREQQNLDAAASALRAGLAADPGMDDAESQISIAVTPQGLRIQITDTDGQPMFAPGSSDPTPRARLLLARVAPVLARLDEPVTITGHTDATTCVGSCRSNWDLSAARAEASRLVLEREGLPDARIAGVAGLADRDLLHPEDPRAAANRRIVLVVHRTHPMPAGN